MIKKVSAAFAFCTIFIFPFLIHAQQVHYFPNRLLIKFESPKNLLRLKSKLTTDPRQAVRRLLSMNGAYSMRPLFSKSAKQKLNHTNRASANELLRIQEVTYNTDINPKQLAAKIKAIPGVSYAEPKYLRQMSFTPNDPINGSFINYHNFPGAWNFTHGSKDIVIAIIDGGVGYTHAELDDKLWVNQDEVPPTIRGQVDQNSNGTITSTEIKQYLQNIGTDFNEDGAIQLDDALHSNSPFIDQVDNDNNDYIDDLFGWDFWAGGGINQAVTTDNNPIHDATDHGTHVAGIAAAETNNNSDIAAAGFNSSYMAVKAGGIPDDPGTPGIDESSSVGFGFEGIIYAVEQGANIINCSWGGSGFSEAERDVINFANDTGVLVVAAAGNEHAGQVIYPAAFDNVLGVGSVETNDRIAGYSNYGYHLDVLATGTGIQSTSYNDDIVSKSGTSMSAPVVSGLAALLKDIHPGWSGQRIGLQIRSSSTFIDGSNANKYARKLGHGKIDAFRALNTNNPGLRVVSYQFTDDSGNKLLPNRHGTVDITITNRGNTTSNLELQIESTDEDYFQFDNATKQVGPFALNDTIQVSFGLSLNGESSLVKVPTLRLNYRDTPQNYNDFSIITYDDFLYDIVDANKVKMSFASNGTIGFTDPLNGMGGVGFIPRTLDGNGRYKEGQNSLFEGGLMLEFNSTIYNAVRSTDEVVSRDFIPQTFFKVEQPGEISDLDGQATFSIGSEADPLAIIHLETFAFNTPDLSNIVYTKYSVQNPSSFRVLKNMYLGIFNDWDLGMNSSNNSIHYSRADSILYVSDATTGSKQPIVAMAHLGPISGALAIDNAAGSQQDSLSFGLYDGFTDTEKKIALTSGTGKTSVQNTDVSAVTASGPFKLKPNKEATVGFVYAFGDDINELRSQISKARAQRPFSISSTGEVSSTTNELPSRTKLYQNYPNPFNPKVQPTTFCIDLQKATHVTLAIYDVLGRKVKVLIDRQLQPQYCFTQTFKGKNLSSGIYFVQLKTDQGRQTIPITLIK